MKRFSVALLVILTSVVCVGASVWEGAAAVSLNGELPDEGYYAATKSFPRNTVVDIINLETGQSIRVIVASGLDSPGLLALVSKEAADAISLNPRTISRIRMTMPSDPVGFSRFTEGTKISGDPDFDPLAAIAAASPAAQPIQEYSVPPPAAPPVNTATRASAPVTEGPVRSESRPPVFPSSAQTPPAPSWQNPETDTAPNNTPVNQAGNDRIVDLPQTYIPPGASRRDNSPAPEPVPDNAPRYNEAAGTYGWTTAPNTDAAVSEPVPPVQTAPPPPVSPESQLVLVPAEQRRPPEPVPPVQTAPPSPPVSPESQLVLLPAEQRRPPEAAYNVLPPEAEIAPIPDRIEPAVNPNQTVVIPEELIIPPIRQPPPQYPPVQEPSAQSPLAQEPSAQEPRLEPVIPPVKTRQEPPAILPPLPSVGREANFSVPRINRLERGKYYIQLAAYNNPEMVETEIGRISTAYPLAVQTGGNPEKPLYRLLLGPVNQGESGALLQRFKRDGYRDAFIRSDR